MPFLIRSLINKFVMTRNYSKKVKVINLKKKSLEHNNNNIWTTLSLSSWHDLCGATTSTVAAAESIGDTDKNLRVSPVSICERINIVLI